ncbi:hypothetical protein SAMN05216480_1085 [Pustulibacterium marinum]|uniref:DUF2059 domain-containing protein n=1 Tax=Pustulibacterium marinum TaxID=1224947 RepID=A0A1I7H9T4_9FLAO|nr:DUF2059 domain-containing protein [Pustulibacterium marinum]SFU57372.1 hypothetical protein SAMN05216480_1085 [Pustulibacterium marinum]
MRKLFLTIMLFVGVVSISHAQEDSYAKTLKTLFDLNGSKESYVAVLDQVAQMYKAQSPSNSEAVDEFINEMKSTSIDDLVQMLVPVYKKQLTEDDLKALIKFYQTPIGKKYAEATPAITSESMQVGQQWGMQLVQKLQQKLQN